MKVLPIFRFVGRILYHKLWVMYYGLKIGGVPLWQLVAHDLSKFSRAEFMPRFRFQILKVIEYESEEFQTCCDVHHARNPHHWQYWLVDGGPREMPEVYVREMVADWFAAEKHYRAGLPNWLRGEFPKMKLHPVTAERLSRILASQGIAEEQYWPKLTKKEV